MKKLALAAFGTIAAGAATAGTLVYTPPVATAIEEPTRMGGSGAWLIPLVIIAVLALALTSSDTSSAG